MATPVERRVSDNHWHLDKRVPISILGVLIVQMCSGLWFISKLDARIAALENISVIQLSAQHEKDQKQDEQVKDSVEKLAKQLEHIDDKLDRIIEKSVNRK